MNRRDFIKAMFLGAAAVAPVRRYWQVGAILAPAPEPMESFADQMMVAMNEMGRSAADSLNRAVADQSLEQRFHDALYPKVLEMRHQDVAGVAAEMREALPKSREQYGGGLPVHRDLLDLYGRELPKGWALGA